jgi:hypothetical protein
LPRIPIRIVPSARPSEQTPREVGREVRALLEAGYRLRPLGTVKAEPERLLRPAYAPRHKIELFDAVYYLSNPRQNPDLRFFVAYVLPDRTATRRRTLHPRLFYKDVSLVWRSASHFARSEAGDWIGKGDVRSFVEDGEERVVSVESTTDLPLEIQTALESLLGRVRRIPRDDDAIALVLRRAPLDRIEPYDDFVQPRRRARACPRNRVNGGRPVARFRRRNDPGSLRFVAGFEPDFDGGIVEKSRSRSRLYGGRLRRFRILSRNRHIQYLFFAGPRHVWIVPPQATTAEISSYGVRTVDVEVDEDLCVPGYEYHFVDEWQDPPVLVSQIPEGFVGEPSELDGSRADASAWLDRLPVVREFRRKVLGRR